MWEIGWMRMKFRTVKFKNGWRFEIENSRTFKCRTAELTSSSHKKKEIKIEKTDLYQTANIRIGKIASSAKYRMDDQFQNFLFLEPNFGFPNWKNSRSLLIFQFKKFRKFVIIKIPKGGILKMRKISNF